MLYAWDAVHTLKGFGATHMPRNKDACKQVDGRNRSHPLFDVDSA